MPYAWFNCPFNIPPQATPGTSPLLQARGWGIAPGGFVPWGWGKGKSKMCSRLISYPDLTLSYVGDLGTRLLLIVRVKYVNSRLTPVGTKGEIGEKSWVVI